MSTVTAVPLRPVKRAYVAWLCVGIVVALLAGVGLAYVGRAQDFLTRNAHAAGVVTTASGLQYKVLSAGRGTARPTDADVALVSYKGTLLDGTVFDQSPQPVPLPVAGMVPGFTEALKLMNKGGKYRLWLKPSLAYGPEGKGPIPPDSTLVFDVELVDFLPEQVVRQLQAQQMMGMPGGAPPPTGR